mmetsp:Transcript_36082/g.107948  ORF Transcript_36082/g.107948 Transcript_36082/m.107948 type:complete len:212 (+) Transcript_36082:1213-1848(+)
MRHGTGIQQSAQRRSAREARDHFREESQRLPIPRRQRQSRVRIRPRESRHADLRAGRMEQARHARPVHVSRVEGQAQPGEYGEGIFPQHLAVRCRGGGVTFPSGPERFFVLPTRAVDRHGGRVSVRHRSFPPVYRNDGRRQGEKGTVAPQPRSDVLPRRYGGAWARPKKNRRRAHPRRRRRRNERRDGCGAARRREERRRTGGELVVRVSL